MRPTPFILWQELKWGPAELLELSQVILNLEQTIAIDGDHENPGSQLSRAAIQDDGAAAPPSPPFNHAIAE